MVPTCALSCGTRRDEDRPDAAAAGRRSACPRRRPRTAPRARRARRPAARTSSPWCVRPRQARNSAPGVTARLSSVTSLTHDVRRHADEPPRARRVQRAESQRVAHRQRRRAHARRRGRCGRHVLGRVDGLIGRHRQQAQRAADDCARTPARTPGRPDAARRSGSSITTTAARRGFGGGRDAAEHRHVVIGRVAAGGRLPRGAGLARHAIAGNRRALCRWRPPRSRPTRACRPARGTRARSSTRSPARRGIDAQERHRPRSRRTRPRVA